MRKNIFITLLLVLLFQQGVWAQKALLKQKVDFEAKEMTLTQLLPQLAAEGGFDFACNPALFSETKYSIAAQQQEVGDILKELLKDEAVAYKAVGSQVIFYRKKSSKKKQVNNTLTGQVIDATTGLPVKGVVITEKYMGVVGQTDTLGTYRFEVNNPDMTLSLGLSHHAYNAKKVSVRVNENRLLNVRLNALPLEDPGYPGDTGNSAEDTEEVIPVDHERDLFYAPISQLGMVQLFVPEDKCRQVEQWEKGISYSLGQVSLLPTIGSNFVSNSNNINTLSLNILAGYAAGVRGVEIGTVANIDRFNVTGAQYSGGVNIIGGSVKGAQFAGGLNLSRSNVVGGQFAAGLNIAQQVMGAQFAAGVNIASGEMYGAQVSGASNISSMDVTGVQLSGISNTAKQDVKGLQLSVVNNTVRQNLMGAQLGVVYNRVKQNFDGLQLGVFHNRLDHGGTGAQLGVFHNYAKEPLEGAQVSALLNSSDGINGLQLGLFNWDRSVIDGAQIGLLNVADTLRGVQVGLINTVEHDEGGVPVGLLSIVHDGYNMFGLSYRENNMLMLNYKTGLRNFYNTVAIGRELSEDPVMLLGYGFGTAPRIWKALGANIDLTGYYVKEGENWFDELNIMGRLEADLTVDIGNAVQLFGGASINGQISDLERNGEKVGSTFVENPFFTHTDDSNKHFAAWVGFQAGVRIGRIGK